MNQMNRLNVLSGAALSGTDAASGILGAFPFMDLDTPPELAAGKAARKKIWDLPGMYHCSVVGTCLSTAELRKLLGKLGMGEAGESDHELHGRGVGLASRRDIAGKLLNKALDDRHQAAIKRYGRAKCAAELALLWREDVKSGDIPGGYWAVLTHPSASYELSREAFGYVHMLSHLVGAANRADIRRLQQLEQDNAALREKTARQEAKIREMALAAAAAPRPEPPDFFARETPDVAESPGISGVIEELRRQLAAETGRRAAVEARLARVEASGRAAAAECRRLSAANAALQSEIDAVERGFGAVPEALPAARAVDGLTVLYVGGRPTQVPHLRQAAQARGASLLHHDGGIEDSGATLAGLVNRADVVMFPVDCVSHAAAGTVKRACRHAGKTFLPLRSAAVTSFIAALSA